MTMTTMLKVPHREVEFSRPGVGRVATLWIKAEDDKDFNAEKNYHRARFAREWGGHIVTTESA